MSGSTRSASKRSAAALETPAKRAASEEQATPSKKRKATKSKTAPSPTPYSQGVVVDAPLSVPMHLGFDFEDAKRHLVAADARFEPMFAAIRIKPFQDLGEGLVNPWRSLTTSILGQQISWLAARAITYKFVRLFYPELPEKRPDDARELDKFPTPMEVAKTSIEKLRTAGLSQRKAEYIQGLAEYFVDGRLTAETLVKMSDEEVMAALTAVRGIGRWTVEMFSIFTLRRPNIVSPGDLGLQKGLIRWFTSADPTISVRKLAEQAAAAAEADPQTALQTPPSSPRPAAADARDALQTPAGAPLDALPSTPITPAVPQLPPFPQSKTLTRASLKARLNKKVKNAYIASDEMDELTAAWSPYRSIGLYLMWTLADGENSAI